jgi:predicted DNA-binding transcriptional regulator AlpA
MTKQSLELTVTEDPITGTWTFTLHGHKIEIERTHGFIKIDTTIHHAPLVQTLNDVQDLAGAPLDYIQHLLSTTTPPVPPARPTRPTSTTESQRTPATPPPTKAPSKAKRTGRARTETSRTKPGVPQPSGERMVLTTDQAGAFLGLSPTTLETLCTRGGGPPFVKLGRRVVYRSEDLARWLAQRVRRSTSDPGTT